MMVSDGDSRCRHPTISASLLRAQSVFPAAPELAIARWSNTADTPTMAGLRGEVVVIEAFQMLSEDRLDVLASPRRLGPSPHPGGGGSVPGRWNGHPHCWPTTGPVRLVFAPPRRS